MDDGGRQAWLPGLGPITSQLCDLGQVNFSVKRCCVVECISWDEELEEMAACASSAADLTQVSAQDPRKLNHMCIIYLYDWDSLQSLEVC